MQHLHPPFRSTLQQCNESTTQTFKYRPPMKTRRSSQFHQNPTWNVWDVGLEITGWGSLLPLISNHFFKYFLTKFCLLTFALFMRYSIDWQKPWEHVLASFHSPRCSAVCGLRAFSLEKWWHLKTLVILLRVKKKKEDLIVLCYVHEVVNSFSRTGLDWAIRCSYRSGHSANRPTASWQNVSNVSLRERERERDGEGERERERERGREKEKEGLSAVAVMLSETLPRCCVLLLCISHCWRPSLSGRSSVSSETSASPLECPRGNSTPEAGSDGWTDTPGLPLWYLQVGTLRKDCASVWRVTCPASRRPNSFLFSKALETAIFYSYGNTSSLATKQQTNLQTDNHNGSQNRFINLLSVSDPPPDKTLLLAPPVTPVTTSGIRSAAILWKCMKIKMHIFRGEAAGRLGEHRMVPWKIKTRLHLESLRGCRSKLEIWPVWSKRFISTAQRFGQRGGTLYPCFLVLCESTTGR